MSSVIMHAYLKCWCMILDPVLQTQVVFKSLWLLDGKVLLAVMEKMQSSICLVFIDSKI